MENHIYRGYVIASSKIDAVESVKLFKYLPNKFSLHFVFGELRNWCQVGCDLMSLPTFFSFIER